MGNGKLTRVLAVDPGDVRIGLALSDPTGTIARPLEVLTHRSRPLDAEAIVEIAAREEAQAILVGVPFGDSEEPGPQARKNLRLAEAIRALAKVPVETWDESETTKSARRHGGTDPLLDARAAAYLLQDYLDARSRS